MAQVLHFLIRYQPGVGLRIDNGPIFHDLEQLVSFYSRNQVCMCVFIVFGDAY